MHALCAHRDVRGQAERALGEIGIGPRVRVGEFDPAVRRDDGPLGVVEPQVTANSIRSSMLSASLSTRSS